MDSSYSRHSHGLEQFFAYVEGRAGLSILELGGLSQQNVSFITGLGHRLYSLDLQRTIDDCFGRDDSYANQSDAEQTELFLRENLDFPEAHFDGALVWDVLEFLSPALLQSVTQRLFRIVKPDSYLLTFFHADERAEIVTSFSYRIADAHTLLLSPRGTRKPAQLFNNRGLERLFEEFQSVKFFLARDRLRELIVKR